MAFPLLTVVTVIMEIISSVMSFLIGYYAMKGYRTTSSKGLSLLYWGFIILGVGTFLRAFTTTYISIMIRHETTKQLTSLINFVAMIYSVTQLIAFSLFAATYVFQGRASTEKSTATEAASLAAAAAFPIYRLFFIPWLELVAITMLSFVTVSLFINWRMRKSSESALVFAGFGLMLLSHVFFLFLPLEEMLLFLGQVTQLAGFTCLVTMLAKVSKTIE